MRRLAIAILLLVLCVLPSYTRAPVVRLVSKAGTDSGTCVGSPCLTVDFAMDQLVAGDTLQIGPGTFTEAITRTTNLTSSTLVTTIQGDPAECADTIEGCDTVVLDAGGAQYGIHFSAQVRNVVIKHLKMFGATKSFITIDQCASCTTSNTRDNVVTDIHWKDDPGTLDGFDVSKNHFHLANALDMGKSRWSEISYNWYEGDPTSSGGLGITRSSVTGSQGGFIVLGDNNDEGVGSGVNIHHNRAEHFLGWIVGQGASRSRVHDNFIRYAIGAGDDGGAQNYNDNGTVFDHNKIVEFCPDSVTLAMLNVRGTDTGGGGNGRRSSNVFYNNTIVLTAACSAGTTGSARIIWRRHSSQDADFAQNNNMVVINNLFVGTFGIGSGNPPSTGGIMHQNINDTADPDAPSPTNARCPPSPLGIWLGNNLWDSAQTAAYLVAPEITTNCHFLVEPFQPAIAGVQQYKGANDTVAAVQLDANYDPLVTSPACSGGASYTDSEGGTASSYFGASIGACAGGGGPAAPSVKLYGAILNGGKLP